MGSCLPKYHELICDSYTPDFTPDPAVDCVLQTFDETRSRLIAGGTFFRSKEFGAHWNQISLEFIVSDNINDFNNPNPLFHPNYVQGPSSEGYPNANVELTVSYAPGNYTQYYYAYQKIDDTGSPIICVSKGLSGGNCCSISAPTCCGDGSDCFGDILRCGIRSQVNNDSNAIIEMPILDGSPTYVDTTDCLVTSFGPTFMSGGNPPAPSSAIRTGPAVSIIFIDDSENPDGTIINDVEEVREWDGTSWQPFPLPCYDPNNLPPGFVCASWLTTAPTETPIIAFDPGLNVGFGRSGAISGDGNTLAFAGSDIFNNDGGVYIYTKNDANQWVFQQKVRPSIGDEYYTSDGISLSHDGNTLAVGAAEVTYGSPAVYQVGAAYIFTRTSTGSPEVGVWTEQQGFTPDSLTSTHRFGRYVELSGDGNTLVISAQRETINSLPESGAAYVFVKENDTWARKQKLLPTISSEEMFFGNAVSTSFDGNIIIASAIGEDYNGVNYVGSVYIFERQEDGTYLETQKLLPDQLDVPEMWFGWPANISDDGNTIIAGAYGYHGDGVQDTGAAFIFVKEGTSFVQQTKLEIGGAPPEAFTYLSATQVGLSADGNIAVVGRHDEEKVYIFERSISGSPPIASWTNLRIIQSSIEEANPGTDESFIFGYCPGGNTISANGRIIVTGAYGSKINGLSFAGRGFVYEIFP